MKRRQRFQLFYVLSLVLATQMLAAAESQPQAKSGPWNLAALKQPPPATWGAKAGLVQEVYYTAEPWQGRPTRVFAYLGRPAADSGPFPAMVLVHGGHGKAFAEWAQRWADRGYVALSMDLYGCGPDGTIYCLYERGFAADNDLNTHWLSVARFHLAWLTATEAQ